MAPIVMTTTTTMTPTMMMMTGGTPTFEPNTVGPDINHVLSAFAFLSTLRDALELTNLTPALAEPNGPFTVFAPTNDAFAKLPEGTLEKLIQPENLGLLEDILLYHVVPGNFELEDFVDGFLVETLLGPTILFTIEDEPSNRRLNRELAVPGNGPNQVVLINRSTRILFADLFASNGFVHIIDEVLMPPDIMMMMMMMMEEEEPTDDIATLVINNPDDFSILLDALVATDLAGTFFEPNGPFTVFAPTNHAFECWPPGLLDLLLKPERRQELTDILLYHVVAENEVLPSSAFSDGQQVPTLLGPTVNVTITTSPTSIVINKSPVVQKDIRATNGVVHAISKVLFPPGFQFQL